MLLCVVIGSKNWKLLFLPFSNDDIQNCMIYLCATMWHETYDEMLKILTSMFRLVAVLVRSLNRAIKTFLDIFSTWIFFKKSIYVFLLIEDKLNCLNFFYGDKRKPKNTTFIKSSAVIFDLLHQARSLSRQSRSTAQRLFWLRVSHICGWCLHDWKRKWEKTS